MEILENIATSYDRATSYVIYKKHNWHQYLLSFIDACSRSSLDTWRPNFAIDFRLPSRHPLANFDFSLRSFDKNHVSLRDSLTKVTFSHNWLSKKAFCLEYFNEIYVFPAIVWRKDDFTEKIAKIWVLFENFGILLSDFSRYLCFFSTDYWQNWLFSDHLPKLFRDIFSCATFLNRMRKNIRKIRNKFRLLFSPLYVYISKYFINII